MSRTTLAVVPGAEPDSRLVVSLVQSRAGALVIDLREQHFAEGIGWFDQRTFQLEPRQFRALQNVLGAGSAKIDWEQFDHDRPATLAFPGPAETDCPRPAVGQ